MQRTRGQEPVVVLVVTMVVAASFGIGGAQQQQVTDPDFRASVASPTFRAAGPIVGIDEGHSNGHTAGGTYKPFAELLRADGYTVAPITTKFDDETLRRLRVLVVANARVQARSAETSAFSEAECDAVQDWVRGGGALLLVADHAPAGDAADLMARHFGVAMGRGFAFERASDGAIVSDLRCTRKAGTLGRHPISVGRHRSEAVDTVDAYTGQSLVLPYGATALLLLGASAFEATDADFATSSAPRGVVRSGAAAYLSGDVRSAWRCDLAGAASWCVLAVAVDLRCRDDVGRTRSVCDT